MTLTGEVLNASGEERDVVGKDGTKRRTKVAHVLLQGKVDGGCEIYNIRSYDYEWELPKVGTKWTSPRVRRYECFDGLVADVSV